MFSGTQGTRRAVPLSSSFTSRTLVAAAIFADGGLAAAAGSWASGGMVST